MRFTTVTKFFVEQYEDYDSLLWNYILLWTYGSKYKNAVYLG